MNHGGLTFEERRVGKYEPKPFDADARFDPTWWECGTNGSNDYSWVSVRRRRVEVARVELIGTVHDNDYPSPDVGADGLRIQLLEVARDQRREGIGSAVVAGLVVAFPDRRLAAYSERADDFWYSVGWTAYYHPEGPRWQTFFMQPEHRSRARSR